MKSTSNKFIEIGNLLNPKRVFERIEHEFIDIMYLDHFSDTNVIMLLDVNINPLNEEDMGWLKSLLDTTLPHVGETNYFLIPYSHIGDNL